MGDSLPFLARYTGTCGRCEDDIRPGQRVKYVAGELVHTGCADGEGVLTVTRKEVVCEKCWLVKPCGCEEE
jgi:hypothetical protein